MLAPRAQSKREAWRSATASPVSYIPAPPDAVNASTFGHPRPRPARPGRLHVVPSSGYAHARRPCASGRVALPKPRRGALRAALLSRRGGPRGAGLFLRGHGERSPCQPSRSGDPPATAARTVGGVDDAESRVPSGLPHSWWRAGEPGRSLRASRPMARARGVFRGGWIRRLRANRLDRRRSRRARSRAPVRGPAAPLSVGCTPAGGP